MKKIILSLALILAMMSGVKSQTAGTLAYNISDTYAHVGLSFAGFGYGWPGTRVGFGIPLSLSVEHGFHEFISAGAFLGMANWRYEYNNGPTKVDYGYMNINFGGRGTFHFAELMNENLDTNIDLTKFDFYISFVAGLEFRNFASDDDYFLDDEVKLVAGPLLGAKYMFSDQFGVFIEGGKGTFGFGTIGLSIRF